MTHTPFVSNPCPATAIVFVSQNLFYGQLPHGAAFFCAPDERDQTGHRRGENALPGAASAGLGLDIPGKT